MGVQIAISTGAPLLRFNYGIITTFLTLSIGGVLKSIVMCSSNVIWKQKFSECKWIYLSSLISIFLIILVVSIPQLTWICVEDPNYQLQNTGDLPPDLQASLEAAVNNLKGNISRNDYFDISVYLVGTAFGILTFICLEILKYYEKLWTKNDKTKINGFELIKRPKKFSFKN